MRTLLDMLILMLAKASPASAQLGRDGAHCSENALALLDEIGIVPDKYRND
jgi:hypothetical protein